LDSDLSYHSYVKASEDKYFIPAFTSEIKQWFPPDLKLEKIGAAPKGGTIFSIVNLRIGLRSYQTL